MRRVIIFILVFALAGCAKEIVKQPEEIQKQKPKEVVKEEIAEKIASRPSDDSKNIEEGISSKDDSITKEKEGVFKFTDIHFDYDKYIVRADALPILENAAVWLRKNKSVNVLVEGHCDERGTYEYNLALGEKRAQSARDFFTAYGINSDRLSIISYGKEKPICTEPNEECWQNNRRAHFSIIE